MHKVAAARGWQWVMMGLRMALRWPAVFGAAGLIAAGATLFPLLGPLALLVFGPVLLAGLTVAAQRADHGQTPTLTDAFTLFHEPGRLRPALALCLPLVAAQFLSFLILGAAVLRAVARSGIKLDSPKLESELLHALAGMGASLLGWVGAATAVVLLGYAFVVIAIPRVGLDRRETTAAMMESLRAVRLNLWPWLLAALALILLCLLPTMLFVAMRALLLAQLASTTVLYSVLGPALYFAWRDIGGGHVEGTGSDAGRDTTPPPYFEA